MSYTNKQSIIKMRNRNEKQKNIGSDPRSGGTCCFSFSGNEENKSVFQRRPQGRGVLYGSKHRMKRPFPIFAKGIGALHY